VNPLIEAAKDGLTQGWLMGVMTAVFLFFFTGWTLWAWWPANRETMDAAARMPLDDGLNPLPRGES
jgi:cbb3-type cytochrome oxidase subunit 3